MDWSPFVVGPRDEPAPRARGLNGPEGLGDRLRTAAFAERQASDAFLWAAGRFADAPEELRAAWKRLAAEEDKHLGWLMKRMEELGVEVAARPVSDRLWRALTSCREPAEFSRLMIQAEERGKAAEDSFRRALAGRDPVTAGIFALISAEEESHIGLQRGAVL